MAIEQRWRGSFGLPEEADFEHPGVITYDPDRGVNLELHGFDEYRLAAGTTTTEPIGERRRRFPLVHGRAGSTPVTLLDCRVDRSRTTGLALKEQELSAVGDDP